MVRRQERANRQDTCEPCMQAAGYLVDWKLCSGGIYETDWDQAFCYEPDNPIGRRYLEYQKNHGVMFSMELIRATTFPKIAGTSVDLAH